MGRIVLALRNARVVVASQIFVCAIWMSYLNRILAAVSDSTAVFTLSRSSYRAGLMY